MIKSKSPPRFCWPMNGGLSSAQWSAGSSPLLLPSQADGLIPLCGGVEERGVGGNRKHGNGEGGREQAGGQDGGSIYSEHSATLSKTTACAGAPHLFSSGTALSQAGPIFLPLLLHGVSAMLFVQR